MATRRYRCSHSDLGTDMCPICLEQFHNKQVYEEICSSHIRKPWTQIRAGSKGFPLPNVIAAHCPWAAWRVCLAVREGSVDPAVYLRNICDLWKFMVCCNKDEGMHCWIFIVFAYQQLLTINLNEGMPARSPLTSGPVWPRDVPRETTFNRRPYLTVNSHIHILDDYTACYCDTTWLT